MMWVLRWDRILPQGDGGYDVIGVCQEAKSLFEVKLMVDRIEQTGTLIDQQTADKLIEFLQMAKATLPTLPPEIAHVTPTERQGPGHVLRRSPPTELKSQHFETSATRTRTSAPCPQSRRTKYFVNRKRPSKLDIRAWL